MPPPVIRFFRPQGPDRVAVVLPETAPGRDALYQVRIGRGVRAAEVAFGEPLGPFSRPQLQERIDQLVADLLAEGFLQSGVEVQLDLLDHPNAEVRARAALRLGWIGAAAAVAPILARLDNAVDELCSYLDALGAIGDQRARDVLRSYAQRRLLSRRRSAVEALRRLGDQQGLQEAADRAMQQLPQPLQQSLQADDVSESSLIAAIGQVDPQRVGLCLDMLYELATPEGVAATHALLSQLAFDRPYVWRYVKSIFKRSMLRHDAAMFGFLAHRIESQARNSQGAQASVKSGYDGVQRSTPIFRRKTQKYEGRSAWRYLRRLAQYRPEQYALAAAETLIHYGPEDAEPPARLYGQFASCFLLNRILWGNSKRLVVSYSSLKHRYRSIADRQAPDGVREEPHPPLWDDTPAAYWRLLGAARLPEVQRFALTANERQQGRIVRTAPIDELLNMLSVGFKPTERAALTELQRRFDPSQPDWALLDRLAADRRSFVLDVVRDWLSQTAYLWIADADRTVRYLRVPDGALQMHVVQLVAAHLTNASVKRRLAEAAFAVLRDSQAENVDGLARAARHLLIDELIEVVSVNDAMAIIVAGSPPAQALAADILAHRPNVIDELGVPSLTLLASHDIADVRQAAHRIMRAASSTVADDPSFLLALVESEWPDTRAAAMDLLRSAFDWSQADVDHLMGLLDSGREDVQRFGQELARECFHRLDMVELTLRLAQHPHRNMRSFSLELVRSHLPDGEAPLSQLEVFFRACLFDTRPIAEVKANVVDVLLSRGLRDEAQAEIAVDILEDFARVHAQFDFERALAALTRLRLAWPNVASPVAVNAEPAS